MIFYFTGTGNSMSVAKELADGLEEELYFMGDAAPTETIKDEYVGFVLPVYCYDIPAFIEEFIQSLDISKESHCFAVVTCGGAPGKSLYSIDEFLKEKGTELSYGTELTMPDNSSYLLESTYDLTSIDKIKEKLPSMISDLQKKKEKRELIILEDGATEKTAEARAGVAKIWGKKESDPELCTQCGDCIKVCPADCISFTDDAVSFGEGCLDCFACWHWCPDEAISIAGQSLKDGKQYTHPDIEFKEMVRE